ncbi:MAG: hypothetical protein CMP63_02640 [Flavobacteriales bacterium]|nr:hypothetical protein [Flavobacteriales bacterium]
MKNLLLIFFLLMLVSWKWRKEKEEIPPGTVRFEKKLFVDVTEIRNIDWREFTYWIIRYEGWDTAQSILPDTLSWRDKEGKYESYVELYYRHPAYAQYPVVGISFEKAKEYAKWRTDRVLEYMLIRDKKDVNINLNPKKYFTPKKYFEGNWQGSIPDSNYRFPVFRLPTQEEWLNFSEADSFNLYPFGFEIGKKMTRRYKMDSTSFICCRSPDTAEIKWKNTATSDNIIEYITAPTRSGFTNSNQLYNTIGNVSEMTSQKGVAMGGNYELLSTKINLKKSIEYENSERWLGFRCVAEFMNWQEYKTYLSKN